MRRWNELTIRAKRLEKQLPGLTGEAKEVCSALLRYSCNMQHYGSPNAMDGSTVANVLLHPCTGSKHCSTCTQGPADSVL
jgi:hypothetical protein